MPRPQFKMREASRKNEATHTHTHTHTHTNTRARARVCVAGNLRIAHSILALPVAQHRRNGACCHEHLGGGQRGSQRSRHRHCRLIRNAENSVPYIKLCMHSSQCLPWPLPCLFAKTFSSGSLTVVARKVQESRPGPHASPCLAAPAST